MMGSCFLSKIDAGRKPRTSVRRFLIPKTRQHQRARKTPRFSAGITEIQVVNFRDEKRFAFFIGRAITRGEFSLC